MKTNRDGRECPPRCVRDHQADPDLRGCVGAERGTGTAGAQVMLPSTRTTPEVAAWLRGPADLGLAFADSPYRAGKLAKLIESAAEAPEQDLRALAAHIREAAAEAWPGQEAEAC
jgi:hypothetical protein